MAIPHPAIHLHQILAMRLSPKLIVEKLLQAVRPRVFEDRRTPNGERQTQIPFTQPVGIPWSPTDSLRRY